MTINEYVDAIASVEPKTIGKGKIVVNLFIAAGSVKSFEVDTANSWLCGDRHCQINRYFPEGKINNPDGLVRYFKRGSSYLERLQEAFIPINTDGIVKCYEENVEVFLRSLANQFASIYNLQWPYDPTDTTPTSDDTPSIHADIINDKPVSQKETQPESKPEPIISQNNTMSDRMIEIFKQAIADYDIEKFLRTDPTKIYYDFRDFQHKVNGFISTIRTFVLPKFTDQEVVDASYRINQFCIVLEEYRRYLDKEASSIGSSRFMRETTEYKARISSTYTKVTNEILLWNIKYD